MSEMSGVLTINLGALARNYKKLESLSSSHCETACSIKADAYGLGAENCAPALYQAGARSFFVATIEEALVVRKKLPAEAAIYTLCGLSPYKEQTPLYTSYNITPVINSLEELAQAREMGAINAALHIDTGMNRLGLGKKDIQTLCHDPSLPGKVNISLIISHFIASEESRQASNKEQLTQFKDMSDRISALYPDAKRSLSNTGGAFLGQEYHFDMIRAGLGLYGAHPSDSQKKNPMEPVIKLSAPILQIRTAKKGETAGYNGTYTFKKDTSLAIISCGYADGLLRSLSNQGTLYWKGYALPVRGRISMDLTICDLSAVPQNEYPKRGDRVEVIGQYQSVDALAKDARTIPYEIMTSLGARYKRIYV
ncbi:MAG: alanine racemase [Alphaproteobacteria bacterium]